MVSRTRAFGLAALASLGLTLVALWFRRIAWGNVLFRTAVLLGERWRESRARDRLRNFTSSLKDFP